MSYFTGIVMSITENILHKKFSIREDNLLFYSYYVKHGSYHGYYAIVFYCECDALGLVTASVCYYAL